MVATQVANQYDLREKGERYGFSFRLSYEEARLPLYPLPVDDY